MFYVILTKWQLFILVLSYVAGAYMLLDSVEAIPGVNASIRSPLITPSSGCLDLTFHYYLYGTSTTMELSVHTITTGRRLHLYLCFVLFSDRSTDSIIMFVWLEFVFLFVRWEPWTCSIHYQGEPGSRLEACRGPLPGNCCYSGKCWNSVCLFVCVHTLTLIYS